MTTGAPILQRTLRLDVAADTRLVTPETAKAALGVDSQAIDERIDDGRLVAFDVSPMAGPARIREVRIWVGMLPGCEIPMPGGDARVAIDHVAGPAAEMCSAQVQARLAVDDNTVHRLAKAGLLIGSQRREGSARRLWITTASLKAFLGDRLLGARM